MFTSYYCSRYVLLSLFVLQSFIYLLGLETLGIFHPHWHSASPATQQRLILLFVQSSATVFESEISSTRSPHDVAAVLRWAFRHLKLDSASFGNNPTWYRDFFEAEKSGSYPPKSFSEILAPQLPPVNWQLLNATVELFSAVAAHAEANGVSGSKLSKLLGLWLLAPERSTSDHHDFLSFYDQWERQGRILEHLFLSYIRFVFYPSLASCCVGALIPCLGMKLPTIPCPSAWLNW